MEKVNIYLSSIENINMPKTSEESRERLSQSNDEKSIEDISFNIIEEDYTSSAFDIVLPKTSSESIGRLNI